MTGEELAKELNRMYFDSKDKEAATMIHLFGVKFAKELHACGVAKSKIATMAGIPKSYGTEINKGVNLAKYVQLK